MAEEAIRSSWTQNVTVELDHLTFAADVLSLPNCQELDDGSLMMTLENGIKTSFPGYAWFTYIG